ncbi:TIGR03118 family protein [Methylomonas koyamae]|uniref:TIGR03118 family protein n=1 Tax=Methylomonas koyamae TaxID=702114 RepID=UPI0006CF48A3|nr:TIGR03118 family protein [Methylomonas koyamae]
MYPIRTTQGISLPLIALIAAISASLLSQQAMAGYRQENLVSNIPGLAAYTDPNLVNPWGISSSPVGPFWVSDNGTGLSTIYNTSGIPQGLVVTVPPPPPGSPVGTVAKPTGQVFNSNVTAFSGDRFIFATEGGTIAGWQGGTVAATRVDNSTSGVNYKGLAIDSTQDALFAANFASSGGLEKYGSSYNPLGSFIDPTLPDGFAPFNVQNIGGTIFVTFAKQGVGGDDMPGDGNGFVDKYDPNTNEFTRLISNGPLNSPWGITIAPSDFGEYSNALLVGNFGDGRINAFDPVTGVLLGDLLDDSGNPIVIDGLWGLAFGNGGNGGEKNKLYFTAGLNDEADGLFGSLSATVPEPGSLSLVVLGMWGLGFASREYGKKKVFA